MIVVILHDSIYLDYLKKKSVKKTKNHLMKNKTQNIGPFNGH